MKGVGYWRQSDMDLKIVMDVWFRNVVGVCQVDVLYQKKHVKYALKREETP